MSSYTHVTLKAITTTDPPPPPKKNKSIINNFQFLLEENMFPLLWLVKFKNFKIYLSHQLGQSESLQFLH